MRNFPEEKIVVILLYLAMFVAPSNSWSARKPRLLNGDVPQNQLIEKSYGDSPIRDGRRNFAPPARLVKATDLAYEKITSADQFDSLAVTQDGVVKSDSVKFLIDNRNPRAAKIRFINGQYVDPRTSKVPEYAKFHYFFAQKVYGVTEDGDQFNAMTYFTNDMNKKKFIAGTLQHFQLLENGRVTSFYGIQFYPQDLIAEATLLFAVKLVQANLSVGREKIGVVLYGAQQTVSTIQADLDGLNTEVLSIDKIYGSIPNVSMNQGEAWGYLRLSPPTKLDELKPEDIPLFKELPLDLSVVAGVITEAVQDGGSHINLKSKERGTPNLVVRDPSQLKDLYAKANQPIHLIVKANGYKIEASTEAVIRQKLRDKQRSRPWVNLATVQETRGLSFDQMAKTFSIEELLSLGHKYGGKAAKLGLLASSQMLGEGSVIQKQMKYRLTPIGFGVPMSDYQKFVKANPEVAKKIEAIVSAEEAEYEIGKPGSTARPMTPEQKIAALDDLRKTIYSSKVPVETVDKIKTQLAQLATDAKRLFPNYQLKKVKVRSSANAEDIEGFDGAGLHDSFGAKISELGDPQQPCQLINSSGVSTKSEMSPATVLCAVKGVYASLWNKRAIEERSFAHIRPRSAAMGLAINQSYDFRDESKVPGTKLVNEVANAVVVTRILNTSGIYGYQMSINTDDNLVTNPTPNTKSEIVIAAFIGDEKPSYTTSQFAKPVATEPERTTSLLSNTVKDRIVKLVRTFEIAYCQANPKYYADDCNYVDTDIEKKKSLDVEVKIYDNGEVLVKQVREFSGK